MLSTMGHKYKRELILVGVIVLLYLLPLFGPAAAYFYTWGNFRNLAIDNLPILVTAAAMTVVIITAQIDISVGSQFLLCGLTAGWVARAGAPMWVVTVATLGVGVLTGLVNGILIARAEIAAIVATLATSVIIRQGIMWWTEGGWIQDLPKDFVWYGLPQPVGQAVYAAVAVILYLLLGLALRYTGFGRSFYAVGCSPEATRRLGMRPKAILINVFVIMGLFTAVAALMNFTRYSAVEANAGLGMEMRIIAAVVVGGTAITGGRGDLIGTLLGVILTCSIGTILTFLHIDASWEHVLQGLIILIAVVSDKFWREG